MLVKLPAAPAPTGVKAVKQGNKIKSIGIGWFSSNRGGGRVLRRCLLFVTVPLLGGQVALAQVPEGFVIYEGHKDQFTIALPAGWSAYDQSGLAGRSSGFNVVIFSPVDLSRMSGPFPPGEEGKGKMNEFLAALGRIDTGETPSVWVNRHPADKGMSCDSFQKKAQERVLRMVKDTETESHNKGRKAIEPFRAEPISLGGCQGVAVTVRTEAPDGKQRAVEVRAASDGTLLYLFVLRNAAQYFEGNFVVYQAAMSSLKFAAAKGM